MVLPILVVMKSFLFLIGIGITLVSSEVSADDLNALVYNEYQITQNEADTLLRQATDRLEKLKQMKIRAIALSKKQGEFELNGKKLMEKYATLLVAKYHNSKDEFEAGSIISEKDQINIGKLFQGYLFAQPLKGQTSAGEAKRILEIGARSLDEMAKAHMNPTEKNNSQLEILEYQVQNAEAVLKRANNLALALGHTPKSGVAPKEDRRAPASIPPSKEEEKE